MNKYAERLIYYSMTHEIFIQGEQRESAYTVYVCVSDTQIHTHKHTVSQGNLDSVGLLCSFQILTSLGTYRIINS